MQRFAYKLVGNVRPVKVAGVDVINAQGHGFTQYGNRARAILRRTENAGAGQLHGTVTHTGHWAAGKGKRTGEGGVGHGVLLG